MAHVIIGEMAELLAEVARFARRYELLPRGQLLVAGISGGPDSLCLLDILRRLAPVLDLKLHVAHLDHRLRGPASQADADFVAQLAGDWDLPSTLGTVDVRDLAARAGLSLEEAARQARYAFLSEVAEEVGADLIAVGHTADDQAETVLMHFLRGSGVAGLRGMLPRTDLSDYHLGGQPPRSMYLVRPLLNTSRAEILDYCSANGLSPRTDESNAHLTFFRNRLRHELLPALEEYNPNIREVLAHTGAAMAGEYEVLAASVEAAWPRVLRSEGSDGICLDLAAWRALPIGMQRAVLRQGIRHLRKSLRNVNWEHVERAVWVAREGTTGKRATLTAGLALEIGYDLLCMRPETETGIAPEQPVPQIDQSIPLLVPGSTALPGGWSATVRELRREDVPVYYSAGIDDWTTWLDAEVVGSEMALRPRQPGDRFYPQGLAGHSTRLNEFMINAKVPRAARPGWPILAGASGIAWVCGLRIDERVIVRPDTQRVWEVTFRRPEG